jgi:hypothetical protein
MSNTPNTEVEWKCNVIDTAYTSTIIIPRPGCPAIRATRVARMVTGVNSNEAARKIFDEVRREFTDLKPNGTLEDNIDVSKHDAYILLLTILKLFPVCN